MDSRDILKEPEEVIDNTYLENIYSLQKELLEGYIGIEGLPPYPINVNTKKNQSLIKDFVGRVIEELGESYESLVFIYEIMQSTMYLTSCDNYKEELVKICNHLQNCNEELADSLHFMVELLIYSNIQPSDIDRYLNNQIRVYPLVENLTGMANLNTLQKAMDFGYLWVRECTPYIGEVSNSNVVNIITKVDNYNDNIEDIKERITIDKRLIEGAHKFNELTYISYKSVMWDITYHLNIARNYLKNKPWKKSQMMTDEIRFQEELVKAFISLMGIFKYMGIETDKNLYLLYYKKNQINKFRQKSNY